MSKPITLKRNCKMCVHASRSNWHKQADINLDEIRTTLHHHCQRSALAALEPMTKGFVVCNVRRTPNNGYPNCYPMTRKQLNQLSSALRRAADSLRQEAWGTLNMARMYRMERTAYELQLMSTMTYRSNCRSQYPCSDYSPDTRRLLLDAARRTK